MRLWTEERGVAMTQAVILLPVLIAIWMGLNALQRLYSARFQSQTLASQSALEGARDGRCRTDPIPADSLRGTEQMESIAAVESDLLSRILGEHPLSLIHLRTESTLHIDAMGKEMDVAGRRILLCNMAPVDGLMDYVVDWVKERLGVF